MDNYSINGNLIEISEVNYENDKSRKKAKFLLCPLNESNGNGVGIKSSEISQAELNTLVGQPLVTKTIYNSQTNRYEFTGHEVKQKYTIDDNGEVIKYNDFTATSPIGYHTNVSIENINIYGVEKQCIVAECTLWTRYTQAMEVIERLGNNLKTSWELSSQTSYEENGVRWLKGITFLANCCLESSTPAYKDAGLLEVAEKQENADELSIAMMNDMININVFNTEISESNQTDNKSDDNKIENNKGGHDNMASENNNEAMELLSSQVKELTQQVSELNVKLSEKDNQIETLTKEKEGFETQLSEKDDKIVELGGTIQTLNDTIAEKNIEISELQPIKEKYEQEMAEKEAKELAEKQEALKKEAISSKYVTEEDFINNEVLKEALSSCDEKTIKSFIADRVIEQAQKICKKDEDKKKKCAEEEKDIEEKAEVSLSSLQEYNYASELENDPMAKLIKSMQR